MRALWRALPCIRLIGTPIEPSQKVPLPPLRRPPCQKTNRLALSGLNDHEIHRLCNKITSKTDRKR